MTDIQPHAKPMFTISYPEDLPVANLRGEIAAAIRDHQVVIVAGETGSGKTTQLPKICLELGRGQDRMIGHTQPRRLAARSVAARIAEELGVELGGGVGYEVRFNDRVSDDTSVKIMTDGILLMEIQRDRLLKRYDTIIIDEAHERSLNIDFLLGYLKRLLLRRPDLKLIVTSATIDLDSFSRHFDDAPVVEVSGRGHPVQTHYLEVGGRMRVCPNTSWRYCKKLKRERTVLAAIPLSFSPVSGKFANWRSCCAVLPGWKCCRLYARLTQAEQNRVFDARRGGAPRVVLATNVAETSLTVPGIRYVIDPGSVRISRYNPRTKLQRLPVEPVSQASANQRQGRCGRTGPGVCFRLYSEADFQGRPAYTDPEIQRTNLAAVVLRMLSLNLGEVEDFPFINPPQPRAVRDGYRLLSELGAVTASGALTRLGRQLARLPVDPRLGRMVMAGVEEGCLAEILVIASALAVQDPRERPQGKQTQADQQHARFRHPRSDFMAWLALWRYYEEQRQALGQSQLRKLCKREYLSFLKLREWRDIHTQLSIAARRLQLRPGELMAPASEEGQEQGYRAIHRALLSGLLDHIAQHREGREYLGARNRKLQIFPGSSQARKSPKWLVASEIVETSQVFARGVAWIDPRWALDANPELLKRSHYSPRWNRRRGQATAYERVTLFGLVLSDKRPVHYGPIAPRESRELLIREALVAGNYQRPPPFLRQNLRLAGEVEDLEARIRKRDMLVDEEVLYRFYDERLPESICTTNRLHAWLQKEEGAAASMCMERKDLMLKSLAEGFTDQFPDHLVWQDLRLALTYQFEPGADNDGVSLTVPVALLNRVPRHLPGWLVPGLLREKCIELVRQLPKDKRKQFVPVPDHIDRALAGMQPGDRDLLECLAEQLSRHSGVTLDNSDWRTDKLDDYYRMNIRVVDGDSKLLGQGRDIDQLISQYRSATQDQIAVAAEDSPVRQGITRWDFDQLPSEWRFRQAGVDIVSFPALVDRGESVAVELCDYPAAAGMSHRLGVLRLLRLQDARQVRYLRKQLLRGNDWSLALAGAGLARDDLLEDLIDGAYVHTVELDQVLPFDRDAFEHMREGARGKIVTSANELEKTLFSAAELLAQLRQLQSGLAPLKDTILPEDVELQLAGLFVPHFVRDTPGAWLAQYPRYLKALRHRLERYRGQEAKDRQYTEMLRTLGDPVWSLLKRRPGLLQRTQALQDYRWLLEEFRVSLFAQHLGTRQAVSEKRLRGRWNAVEEWLNDNPN